LKILLVYGAPVLNRTGGHEYVVQSLAEGVINQEYKVEVVTPNLQNHFVVETKSKVKYLSLPSFKLYNRVCFFKPTFLKQLVRAISYADVIHIHCPDNPFAFIIGLLSKLMGKPMVVTVLAYGDDLKRKEHLFQILGIITIIEQAIAAIVSDKIHVESKWDQVKLNYWSKKVSLIPPGISNDIKFGTPKSSSILKMREEIKVLNFEKIILYIGRAQKVKGLDHAIRAVALLCNKGVKVKLVIAGPDDGYIVDLMRKYSNEFKQGVAVYLGPISNDDKLALLDLADVVVIPSISDVVEAYSIVASEAWARKKPVVSYAVGALKYRVTEGVNGFVAKPLDIVQLSHKLFMALSFSKTIDPPFDVIDWETVSEDFRQLYRKLWSKGKW
jgi:glycosyltransferase involved in cell wall biosynthesis